MKQKFLSLVLLCLMVSVSCKAYAQTIEVKSVNNFSTANPPKTVSVILQEPLEVENGVFLAPGVEMLGNLTDVVSPKRLKRDADFSFEPISYTDLNGESHVPDWNIDASYTQPIDKKKLAKKTALGVGSFFVKGLSVGVAAVSGAVQNENGNRIKSSVSSAYQASPFSYAEKGQDLEVLAGQNFFLKFPSAKKIEKCSSKNIESNK